MAYSVSGGYDDWRKVRGKLFKIRDELVKSVNDDGVKTYIYSQIYQTGIPNIGAPIDTGALVESPTTNGTPTPTAKGRVAFGSIDENGIHYDPYTIHAEGDSGRHYAQVVAENSGWSPIDNMKEDIAQGFGNSVILDIVYNELRRNING